MPFVGIGVGIGRQRFAQGGIFAAYAARVAADGGVTEAGACVNAVSGISLNSSLLLVPSGYKSGVVYSQIPTNGDGDLTFTRASDATRVNSDGEIEVVGSDVPRLDYSQGSCPALLLEPQRTNLVTYSEQFDNASWSKAQTSVIANTTTSPDGTTNADSLIENTATALHQISQSTLATGGIYTISIYAKKNGRNWIFLNIAAAANYGSWFDIENGVPGTIQSNITNATITNVGNGWYRCSVTANTGALSPRFLLTITTANNAFSYTGDGTSGVYLWGAQLEAGSYATSYIPTTSATVTRLADTFSRDNIYTNGLISSSGGTWFVELKNNVSVTNASTDRGVFIGDTNTGISNALAIRRLVGGRNQIAKVISGSTGNLFTTTTDTVKIAIKWNGTSADVFVNGVKEVSATSFTTTILENIGTRTNEEPYQYIQNMALYPTPLSDSDCISLTTL